MTTFPVVLSSFFQLFFFVFLQTKIALGFLDCKQNNSIKFLREGVGFLGWFV